MPWVVMAAFWMLVAVLFSAVFYFATAAENPSVSWGRVLVSQLVHWGLWIGFTPLVLWIARQVPLERNPVDRAGLSRAAAQAPRAGNRWGRWILIHLGAGVGVGLVHLSLAAIGYFLIQPFSREDSGFLDVLLGLLSSLLIIEMCIYWAVLGVGYAVDYYRKYKEGEVHASRLEAQLAQAQLQALRMQLHPHFLFNTLNTVSTLVRTNRNAAATDMIAGLSELLRLTLESSSAQEVSLKQELDFLERYLDIEQIRFGDRLRVRMEIEPGTLHAAVPNLVLQPLVENAIRHGIARRAEGGVVEIRAERTNGVLRLQVRDDGPGLPEGDPPGEGVGLSNTMARLERLYGNAQRVTLANADEGGALITLELPFHPFDF